MARVTPNDVFSHWYHLIEQFNFSSKEFYTAVEQAVKEREVPDIKIMRVDFKEGGMMSAKREYLRIRRKALIFDICAAPFGNGFFVSWWLGEPAGCIGRLAQSPLFAFLARPDSYYNLDSSYMFQEAIRNAVNEVVDQITEGKGVKTLTEAERKPISSQYYQR